MMVLIERTLQNRDLGRGGAPPPTGAPECAGALTPPAAASRMRFNIDTVSASGRTPSARMALESSVARSGCSPFSHAWTRAWYCSGTPKNEGREGGGG